MRRGSANGVVGLTLAVVPWALIGAMEWLRPNWRSGACTWSTCAILLATPLALTFSLAGLYADARKCYAAGGAVISGTLAALLLASAFR